jgi:flagellar biosynthesis GTPase FlhF
MVESKNNQPATAGHYLEEAARRLNFARLISGAAVCALFLLLSAAALAQSSRNPNIPNPTPTPEDKHSPEVDFSSRVEEMRRILIVKEEKKAYEANVARAKEAQQLAADLKSSYEAKDAFTAEDQKKLERLEKLTRRIRNEAGGSDSEDDEKDLPSTLKSAVSSLADMAEGLCKEVKNTPRKVLSASIIGQANKLIGVIRFVRDKVR